MSDSSATPATLDYDRNFARITDQDDDAGRVELAYDLDREHWRWLMLPTSHPVLISNYQYFSTITASLATGQIRPDAATALTRMQWNCAPAAFAGGPGAKGVCEGFSQDSGMGFSLRVSDADDRTLYTVTGEGFDFGERDFRAMRDEARRRAHAADPVPAPAFVAPQRAGLGAAGHCFIGAPIETAQGLRLRALVGRETGFYPGHPFHDGSGDHVNAPQMLDCVMQAAHALGEPSVALVCTGGEVQFRRFVELDIPFDLVIDADPTLTRGRLSVRLSQIGQDNARFTLHLVPANAAPIVTGA